ncbi:MarR family transcriptional regulator [Sneathiella marina]|uniref:MarR family transcriptional regulator n=1 Tax=Sneathiella marina TaxID=2950108 RepID=A0ABY4VX23_9PROT|nr:MarR family transcriptional regulator [Sneathiella marina]USG59487.1 MarR family transcriptional regulator [Sneathiella marina]
MLNLPRFLPYRLTKLSGFISRNLGNIYSERFNLTIPEWRIIALLGSEEGLTAQAIGIQASLDKVRMSRAVDRLVKSGRITKQAHKTDRRSSLLYLTESGREVLEKIVPLAQQYEDRLLKDFNAEEIELLDSFLNRLDSKAESLQEDKIF